MNFIVTSTGESGKWISSSCLLKRYTQKSGATFNSKAVVFDPGLVKTLQILYITIIKCGWIVHADHYVCDLLIHFSAVSTAFLY